MSRNNVNAIWIIVGTCLLGGGMSLGEVPTIGAAFFTVAGAALGFRVGFEMGQRS